LIEADPLDSFPPGLAIVKDGTNAKVAVVIPSYRVKAKILDVIKLIGPEVCLIFVVDDQCPEGSGQHVLDSQDDPRVKVIFHSKNKGVGGAVISGYRAAADAGADIVVKVDGDGQMDPRLLSHFVAPIVGGEADYAKGNRFYSRRATNNMPAVRLIGNAMLSFMTKASSGYYGIFDPTNGYTAIHKRAILSLDLDKIAERYFFESDLLIQLGDVRAVVVDVPMEAVYADEKSSLRVSHVVGDFLVRHAHAYAHRLFYSYFIRDFNMGTINLVLGFFLTCFGVIFGAIKWAGSIETGVVVTTGTVMLSVLPIVIGVQMLLFFLAYDMSHEPKRPLQARASLTTLARPVVDSDNS
jgi:dolichol-phosphate mannosyltransferase